MKNITSTISEYSSLALAVLLASIGLKAFLLPNGFLDGGVTGIAILIAEKTDVDISLLLILISAPFLVLGWYTVSRKIFYKSIITIVALSIFIHFENFAPLTSDKLLISIFGGLFLGSGIGLAIKNGAVLDGSEILGLFISERWGVSIGKVILVFNVFLFAITALILSIEVAMYSILTYLVTSKVIDLVIQGFEDYVGLMIVSEKFERIEKDLMLEVGVGMTLYSSARGYGSRGKQTKSDIIHTVINRIDIRRTYNVIEKVDPNAFIIEFDVNNIQGGVLRKYLSRKGERKLAVLD